MNKPFVNRLWSVLAGTLMSAVWLSTAASAQTACVTQNMTVPPGADLEVRVDGQLTPGVSAKDIILALIARIGIGGGTGHVFEYTGSAIRGLTMEQRMTVCNMSIEGGARAGLIAPDDTTFEYLHGRA